MPMLVVGLGPNPTTYAIYSDIGEKISYMQLQKDLEIAPNAS